MSYKLKSPAEQPQRTPWGFAFFLALTIVVAWTSLRALLLFQSITVRQFNQEAGGMLLLGMLRDLPVALLLVTPALLWFFLVPQRWYVERWQRFFFWCFIYAGVIAFAALMVAEYFQYVEFHRRFDLGTVHVLQHRWQAERLVPQALYWWTGAMVLGAILFAILVKRRFASMWLVTASPFKRFCFLLLALTLAAGFIYAERHANPLQPREPRLAELARSGLVTLTHAIQSAAHTNTSEALFARGELQPDPPLGVTGTIRVHDAFPSKLVAPRNVHVWLPPSYEAQSSKRYPVIYVHDGQNQFDPKLSFIGVDWALDETMTRLIAEGKTREAIIVAIWNTSQRTKEYVPSKAVISAIGTRFEGAMRDEAKTQDIRLEDPTWKLSGEYLKFIVEELKPFVDREYRTLANRDNTFTMGSSAGAMISLYAVSEHPSVFGGAACLSTHWPLANGVLVEYFRNKLPDPDTHRIYFDFGTETMDKEYEPYQLKMDAAMESRGFSAGTNWMTIRAAGAEHSEKAWRRRVHLPLEFLLGNGS
jgi:predicted alpha/beta superfamily hydrolase